MKRAAYFLIAGMLIQVATLFFGGPESFLVFAGLGATLVVAGIALYLLAVLRAQPTEKSKSASS